MGCEHFELPDGTTGIVCTRGGKTKQCGEKGCRRKSVSLCDFPVEGGTCDRLICRTHTHTLSINQALVSGIESPDSADLCPVHAPVPVIHICHANGCTDAAHDEIPFCKRCFGLLPEAHRKKLWATRPKGVCGACVAFGPEDKTKRSDVVSEDWDRLYHLGLSVLLQVYYGGCGAPPPYQDDDGFCWACGIPDALKNEAVAKKVVTKFGLTA